MDTMEAQGGGETRTITNIKMPLYWLIISVGITIRVVFTYLDRLHRAEQFWSLSADFWTKIGALTW
jgi:hypothetical protein